MANGVSLGTRPSVWPTMGKQGKCSGKLHYFILFEITHFTVMQSHCEGL